MASSFSDQLRLELMATGEKDGTWGTIANANVFELLEEAVSGLIEIDFSGGNVTASANNGSSDQARHAMLKFTGQTAARDLTIPAKTKGYLVWNAGSYNINVQTSGGAGVLIGAGQRCFVFCDGTDCFRSEGDGGAIAWALVTVTAGTPALTASHGVAGIVDDGAGTLTVQWEPDFASSNYAVVATTDVGASDTFVQTISHLAATAQVIARNLSGVNTDPAEYHVIASGALASG